MARCRRLRNAQDCNQVPDTKFAFQKKAKNAQPSAV
jgi:hypothetical protein